MAHYRLMSRHGGRGALAAAIAAVLAMPTVAAAQEATELEEIVVSGIRAGIESAIEEKRENTSIVEAITAEDIGKLPDTSIAESISRLPGLTSQRAEGRASAISLRGTDPGFTTALLNGREQVSTGDNRSVEFDQYPSELISSVVVYKTPDSQLVGQGLAGTIDLRTVRPLDFGRQAIAFNLRGEQNSNGDLGADSRENGYRASFSYIDQFAGDTIGVAFGIAYLDQAIATRGVGTYEPWHENASDSFNYQPQLADDVYVTNGMKVRTDMGYNIRTGVMAALQFRPNDVYSSIVDLYYTKRKQEDNARSLEVNFGNYPIPCCDSPLPPGSTPGFNNPVIVDNTVVGGNLTYRVPLARNFLFETEDSIQAAGWYNEFQFSDAWTVSADIGYSKADRDESQPETNGQILPRTVADPTFAVTDTGTWNLLGGGMPQLSFTLDYADPDLVYVGPTIYGSGYLKNNKVEDELTSFRVDAERALENGWMSSVAFGVNYTDRSKTKEGREAFLNTIDNARYRIADEYLLAPTNLSYAGAGRALAWNVNRVLDEYFQPIVWRNPQVDSFLLGKNWTVDEKITTGYIRAELNHELTDAVTLRGNIGVQYVQTDQSSTSGAKDNLGNVYPFTLGKTYDDVLPALNLAFMLPSDQAVRVGVARSIARARMDQLRAASEYGYNQFDGKPSGSGGNPRLDPWRADAYDISYEKYLLDGKGYVSIAGFYKDLKSYIYNTTIQDYDFSVYELPDFPPGYFPPGITPQQFGSFTAPANGKGGDLKGIELATSLPGELLSDSLEGFGVILSYAHTTSGIKIVDTGGGNFIDGNGLGEIPLPGLSEDVWNATLYYEKAGFGARIATRSRSEYIGEITNFANERKAKYVKGDQITDAQVSYAFGEGRLEGLSILLQVNNLTNEPYIAYSTIETRVQDYQEYGRQVLLGFNYRR